MAIRACRSVDNTSPARNAMCLNGLVSSIVAHLLCFAVCCPLSLSLCLTCFFVLAPLNALQTNEEFRSPINSPSSRNSPYMNSANVRRRTSTSPVSATSYPVL